MKSSLGEKAYQLAQQLFPIPRSIMGEGFRSSLRLIELKTGEVFTRMKFKTGDRVFDWSIPHEWRLVKAEIRDELNIEHLKYKENNLQVINGSESIDIYIKGLELKKYTITAKDPTATPYITSYYGKNAGFCLSKEKLAKLSTKKQLHLKIKSEKIEGYLEVGEVFLKGRSKREIFFSTYLCHPMMGNNELSGPVVQSMLIKALRRRQTREGLRYSYRFAFLPETIGSIAYLSKRKDHLKKNLIAGYVLTCLAKTNEKIVFMPSRLGSTYADSMTKRVLEREGISYRKSNWLKRGSDERQYCAPGIDLPMVSLMKGKYGEYKEYHTSKDDLNLISAGELDHTISLYLKIVDEIERQEFYENKMLCEPMMSKRKLYSDLGQAKIGKFTQNLMNVLSFCDGFHDLQQIETLCRLSQSDVNEAIAVLSKNKLICLT
jgi:aminopeptidase-like protein